jgi:phosphatidylethanolamine-binding protein (PEBP) family uncharacterized protein
MTKFRGSLVLVSALALGGMWACSSSPSKNNGNEGGEGGEGGDATGGKGTGGKGTGGTTSTGGSTGSTGGSTGSTGGSTGSTGGSTGSTGGSSGSTGGSTGTGGSAVDAGTDSGGGSGGPLSITVESVPDPAKMRLCFKPEACGQNAGEKNVSPQIDWTGIPPGTQSLVLTTEDLTGTPVCHQIICNIPPTVTSHPHDSKGMIPAGAQASYGHSGKTAWYGPGADMRNYEIKIWALAAPMFEGGCGGAPTSSRMHCARLKEMAKDKTKVLATASKVLWGQSSGKGCP